MVHSHTIETYGHTIARRGSFVTPGRFFCLRLYWYSNHYFRHTSRDPPKVRHTSRTRPRFLEGLVQKTRTKAPLYKFCLNCLWGFLSGRFCQRVFCLEGFVRRGFCPFPFCQNTSVTSES